MGFFGKATYNAGSDLPELMEDVSDLISIVSPFETPLLDRLGEPQQLFQRDPRLSLLPRDILAVSIGEEADREGDGQQGHRRAYADQTLQHQAFTT